MTNADADADADADANAALIGQADRTQPSERSELMVESTV